MKETRSPHRIIAGLQFGSNLGDRAKTLEAAAEHVQAQGAVTILRRSAVYETEPVECGPQPWYLNQVCLVTTRLLPDALLAHCQRVERALGRLRRVPRGPRTLDIDLLFYGGLRLRTSRLTLPHPGLERRRSMLEPLSELETAWVHPFLHKTPTELLSECRDASSVRLFPSIFQN